MIHRYRQEQCQIIASQYSILKTVLAVLNKVKLQGLTHTHAITAVCVTSTEDLINCLNMRKYFGMLFAPTEPLPSPYESSASDEGETCE